MNTNARKVVLRRILDPHALREAWDGKRGAVWGMDSTWIRPGENPAGLVRLGEEVPAPHELGPYCAPNLYRVQRLVNLRRLPGFGDGTRNGPEIGAGEIVDDRIVSDLVEQAARSGPGTAGGVLQVEVLAPEEKRDRPHPRGRRGRAERQGAGA